MYSGLITTEQMTASTHSNRVQNARLNSSQAWRAHEDDMNPWFQVEFYEPVNVSGLATQGNGRKNEVEYIREYTVEYSLDDVEWHDVLDENGVDPMVSCAGYVFKIKRSISRIIHAWAHMI